MTKTRAPWWGPSRFSSPPVSRILFGASRPSGDHPSGTDVAAGLVRPTRGLIGGSPSPLSGLAPGGVCLAARSPGTLVGSYPTVSPLPVPEGHRRSALCCTAVGSPRLAVSQHRALWSPDCPRLAPRPPGELAGITLPAWGGSVACRRARRPAHPGRSRGRPAARRGW